MNYVVVELNAEEFNQAFCVILLLVFLHLLTLNGTVEKGLENYCPWVMTKEEGVMCIQ